MKSIAKCRICRVRLQPGSLMIVCSCNVLSDHQVRTAVSTAAPRTAGQVYGCLGCSAQCGRCARTIRKIMDEASIGAGCPPGCCRAAHSGNRNIQAAIDLQWA